MTLATAWLEFYPGLQQNPLLASIAVILLLYYPSQWLYLYYFHPLASFPGHPAAAFSNRWLLNTYKEFPEKEFEKLHGRYQTRALRIAPNELHITDVHQYKTIYSNVRPFLKDPAFYNSPNFSAHSSFAEVDPTAHKERRKLLNPLFSRNAVLGLEQVIQEKTNILIRKIDRLCESQLVNINGAARCTTSEVVMEFAFSKAANLLEENETSFESHILQAFDGYASNLWDFWDWPLIQKMGEWMPECIATKLRRESPFFLEVTKFAESCLQHYQTHGNTTNHPVVFDRLASLSQEEMVDEALEMLVAGSDTTASTLTSGFLHITSNPEIQDRLARSLQDITLDANGMLPLVELEKNAYLIACVKEALRVGTPVPGRLPRIVPKDPPFLVDGKVVPPGTAVSISAYTMHFSEELWGPDARIFNPDRWLDDSQGLDQYLCSFSKGLRMCVGQNVAYAEITIIMASIFRHFQIALPEDFVPPMLEDRFELAYARGLPVKFSVRK